MAETTEHSPLRLDTSTRLAFERTRVAYERTMMAWIRTATSLITFGFAVYKFFQLEVPSSRAEGRLIGPREFGLMLVTIGLASLLLATIEHRQNIRALGAEFASNQLSLAVLLAALIAVLGIGALLVMIFRQ
jgi:putative membrane protein